MWWAWLCRDNVWGCGSGPTHLLVLPLHLLELPFHFCLLLLHLQQLLILCLEFFLLARHLEERLHLRQAESWSLQLTPLPRRQAPSG